MASHGVVVRFRCPSCRARSSTPAEPANESHACARCGAVVRLRFAGPIGASKPIDRCALCGSERFYVEKDFDQRIGCVVIAVGAIFTPWTYGLSLAVCALIDLFLFRRLPDVAKCYACKATYVGVARNPLHQSFDLHMLEKYEAEARREGRAPEWSGPGAPPRPGNSEESR